MRRGVLSDIPCACAWATVVLFLAACVVFPLGCVAAALTPGSVATVFSSAVLTGAIRNTAVSCAASTVLSVLTGYAFAYAVVRGGVPFPRLFAAVPVVHLVSPPFVGGLSFILLFGKQGFITHRLLGLNVSLYGFWGLLLSQVLCFFPIAYLICAGTLRGMNPSLEQAARGMGAGRARIFLTVTLPLSLPGILSSLLFIAVSVLSDFGNPMIVAGRFRVLAVEIYTQLTGWLNAGASAVLGLVLVVPSVALFAFQNRLLKKNYARMATIGGKGSTMPPKTSSRATRALLTAFCALVSLLVAAQFIAIVAGAFQKLWGIDTSPTLAHVRAALSYGRELRNSLAFAAVAAVLATIVAGMAAYVTGRTALPLRRFVDVAVQLPAAVPGSLFGLALSLAANRLGVRAHAALIVCAMTIGFMPFSYRILSASFSQVKVTLDDSARALGAGRIRVLVTVLAPISAGGVFSALLYDFVRGVGTMSAVIFLVSFRTPLASIKILNLAEQGDWGRAAALALILTLVTFAVLGAGAAALRRTGKAHGAERQTVTP